MVALSPEKATKKEKSDPIGTVERLMLSEKEKQMRLHYLRKKQMLDAASEVQDRPQITSHPSHNKKRAPIHLRKTPSKSIDQEMSDRRRNNPPPDPHPFEECTFQPDLSKSNSTNKHLGERSIDDLFQWNQKKNSKLKLKQMERGDLGGSLTFTPQVNPKSKQLTRDRRGSIEDRLYEKSKQREEKLAKLKSDLEKGWFKPTINEESRRLIKEKGQEYRKKENGKSENIDFWKQIPKGGKKQAKLFDASQSAQAKQWLENRTKHNALQGNRHITGCESNNPSQNKIEKRVNGKNRNRSKSKEVVENYVSPYNKNMLASGLPLKTLIKGSKEAFNTDKKNRRRLKSKENKRRKRKLTSAKEFKLRTASRSRSRARPSSSSRQCLNEISITEFKSQSNSQPFFYRSDRKGNRSKNRNNSDLNRSKSRSRSTSKNRSKKKVRISNFQVPHKSKSPSRKSKSPNTSKQNYNHTSFCETMRFKKETNAERKLRLFGAGSSTSKPQQNLDGRTKEQKLLEKLIYKDCYDSSGNLVKKDKFSTLYAQNLDSFPKARLRAEKLRQMERGKHYYHPQNKDSFKRALLDTGNQYMYQSFQENEEKGGSLDRVEAITVGLLD